MQPNLFHFATSELSQDAFLAWLLAWADADHTGEILHDVGVTFVKRLFMAAGAQEVEPQSTVSVQRQVDKIDLLALVGDHHALVIEDKVDTKNHSDQLRRYREVVERRFPNRKMIPVYLKTGDQADYGDVRAKGWTVFKRSDLLDILRTGRERTDNAIFQDFLEHIETIEAEVQAYRTKQVDAWPWRAWHGFFQEFKEELAKGGWDAGWGYVPNQRGGFMACWWGWWAIASDELYIQLQEEVLAIKVQVRDRARRRDVRNEWSQRVLERLQNTDFERPQRMGSGRTMTVGEYGRDYRQVGSTSVLDMESTMRFLRELTDTLDSLTKCVHEEGA